MIDTFSPDERSEIMRRVKGMDTTPEIAVRSLAHRLGYRFRLHKKDLPGKPDLVFPSRMRVIFVHGCFWHSHPGCSRTRIPDANRPYWEGKILRNMRRDEENVKKLKGLGWRVLVIWECETNHRDALSKKLVSFLGSRTAPASGGPGR